MLRKYLATTDDGHDFADIEYYSEHRANSRANIQDCKREIRLKWGRSEASRRKIIRVVRNED